MKLSDQRNFLESPNNYNGARLFWKTFFDEIKSDSYEFVENKYQNGTEILDGNPLYTACFENRQAVRIIQKQVTTHEPIFTCWIQNSYLNEMEINELVIYLQPLQYLVSDISMLVKLHIKGKLSNKQTLRINKKYQIQWDCLRSKRILSRLEKISLFDEQLPVKIEINQSRLRDFAKIVYIENSYINVASNNVISPVSSSLKKVENRVSKLKKVITLKGAYMMSSTPKMNAYNVKVKNIYVSSANFNKSLISKIIDLKKELEDLKEKL